METVGYILYNKLYAKIKKILKIYNAKNSKVLKISNRIVLYV